MKDLSRCTFNQVYSGYSNQVLSCSIILIQQGKRWLAELRKVSVIFIMLESGEFKEEKLGELQTVIVTMQKVVDKYEGIVRQFLIE